MAEAACRREKNKKRCTCTYDNCHRMGMCCECVAYHRSNDEIPGCFFPPDLEAKYNRSMRAYFQYLKNKY